MSVTFEHAGADGIVKVMWAEAGVQFRSNVFSARGQTIPLHAHSYDHVSMITQGVFDVVETLPDGSAKRYRVAAKGESCPDSAGYRITIPAWHQHTFTMVCDGPGEVLCMWASGES